MAIYASNTVFSQWVSVKLLNNGCVEFVQDNASSGGSTDPGTDTSTTQVETIECRIEVATGASAVYEVPWVAVSEESLLVVVGGVRQHAFSYDVTIGTDKTTITFAENVPAGETVEVYGFQTLTADRLGTLSTPGDGTASYTLPWFANTKSSLIVSLDGLIQHQGAYDILYPEVGVTELRFVEPIPAEMEIQVLGLKGFPEGTFQVATFAGDDTTTVFTAPWYFDGCGLIVTIDGVKQSADSFTWSETSDHYTEIVFGEAPETGTEIEALAIDFSLSNDDPMCRCTLTSEIAGTGANVVKEIIKGNEGHNMVFRSLLGTGALIVEEANNAVNFAIDYTLLEQQLDTSSNVTVTGNGLVTVTEVNGEYVVSLNEADLPAAEVKQITTAGNYQSLIKNGNPTSSETYELYGLRAGNGIIVHRVGNDIIIADKNGGNYVNKLSNYTIDMDDETVGVGSRTTPLVMTLPPVSTAGPGKSITIKDEAGVAGTYTIILEGNSGETIDGQASTTIDSDYGAITVYCNGTAWFIKNKF